MMHQRRLKLNQQRLPRREDKNQMVLMNTSPSSGTKKRMTLAGRRHTEEVSAFTRALAQSVK